LELKLDKNIPERLNTESIGNVSVLTHNNIEEQKEEEKVEEINRKTRQKYLLNEKNINDYDKDDELIKIIPAYKENDFIDTNANEHSLELKHSIMFNEEIIERNLKVYKIDHESFSIKSQVQININSSLTSSSQGVLSNPHKINDNPVCIRSKCKF